MNLTELLQQSGEADVLAAVAVAIAAQHERRHPPRVSLPKGYDPIGKSLNAVLRETGIHAYAVRRIFRRLGLLSQIQPQNAVKTHCKRGHEFTLENTFVQKRGDGIGRICRACVKDRSRTPERRARQRARRLRWMKDPGNQALTKAYQAEYLKTYRLRPGVRERRNERQRLRRAAAGEAK